jgi:hypothetical protein
MNTRTKRLENWTAKLGRSLLAKKQRSRRRPAEKGSARAFYETALEVIAHDCTSFVEGAASQTRRVVKDVRKKKNATGRIWLPSFLGLGATDFVLSTKALGGTTKGLGLLGAAGGVGLIAASSLDLWRSQTPEEFLDAGGDLAWGVQGLSYLTVTPSVATLTTGLGFVGAVVQMSSGVLRITRGVRVKDTHSMKLGALDIGGGILWAALDVAAWGNPIVLGSYVVLMVGREAYANKDALRQRWLKPKALPQPVRI